jgi:hypothetical protein
MNVGVLNKFSFALKSFTTGRADKWPFSFHVDTGVSKERSLLQELLATHITGMRYATMQASVVH